MICLKVILMSINIFEGFRRLNKVILAVIFFCGVAISYNQTVSIEGENVYLEYEYENSTETYGKCETSIYKTIYLARGSVGINYCFNLPDNYSFFSNEADKHKMDQETINKYQKIIDAKWPWEVWNGILITIACMLGYMLSTFIIKYVIKGFLNEGKK